MSCKSGLPDSLNGMLDRLGQRAPASHIDLGLGRVQRVLERLGIDLGASRVMTVGGTNGKGSTVAFVESIACAAGRSCMCFCSPHVVNFNERFRLDGQGLPDHRIAEALRRVERARGQIELTWFEQVALAAFCLAAELRPDWLVLEVGLGGRLDAVNVIDADVAVITSIGLDHQNFLGRTRAAIAFEKCGIARAGRPLVVGEKRPPNGMLDRIRELGAIPIVAGRQFKWRWSSSGLAMDAGGHRLRRLTPALHGRQQGGNAAAAG
ncbi:MAG: bifunctional folylpolyglutamate synthase/dihydrofolate synthase, partial [Xanthomonadaceae bacterium]|nr:bifunctional folylpolyglutamate synthase/dihydrofolate synthase [Xanthomonadaceae bacterium]